MKCKCGYEGEPEYGEFFRVVESDGRAISTETSRIMAGQVMPIPSHVRCPKCKTTEHIIIETWEHIKIAILYPEYCSGSSDWRATHGTGHIRTRKAITFLNAGTGIGGYSMYCPVCDWGEAGGLPQDKVEELRKLYIESVKA